MRRPQLLRPLKMRNGDQSDRSIGGIVAAALITFWVLAQPISSAQATTTSVEATFSGQVIGDFNGTDYVGPLGHCDPSSSIPCSHTFLPSTATVTGTVTETPGMFNFGTGPVPAITTTQSFQGSGAFGSFTTKTSSVTPGSNVCDLFCLSVNGFGGTTATGSPVTATLGLQPNYSGAPLNATTLPIVYPLNFTSDSLTMGASGGTFQSGNLGFQPALSCDFDEALEERGWRDGYRVRPYRRSDRGCGRDRAWYGRHQPDRDIFDGRHEAVSVASC
jgi:hypothetical protein